MKTKTLLLCSFMLIGVGITFQSCQKEPVAAIKPSATSCEVGQSINFYNTTTEGDHYKWTVEGQTSTEKELTVTFNTSGTKTIKLEAFSKNDKKSDEAVVSINVTDVNAKFAGTYTMQGSCVGTGVYKMAVSAAGTKGILLTNFGDMQNNWILIGTVSGSTFLIPSQTFTDADGDYDISGNGTLTGNTLTVNLNAEYTDYTDSSNDFTDNCTDTGTK